MTYAPYKYDLLRMQSSVWETAMMVCVLEQGWNKTLQGCGPPGIEFDTPDLHPQQQHDDPTYLLVNKVVKLSTLKEPFTQKLKFPENVLTVRPSKM